MGSFKLEKGGAAKQQAQQAGVFLIILGLPISLLVHPIVGGIMILLGIIFALGGSFASS